MWMRVRRVIVRLIVGRQSLMSQQNVLKLKKKTPRTERTWMGTVKQFLCFVALCKVVWVAGENQVKLHWGKVNWLMIHLSLSAKSFLWFIKTCSTVQSVKSSSATLSQLIRRCAFYIIVLWISPSPVSTFLWAPQSNICCYHLGFLNICASSHLTASKIHASGIND